MKEIFSAINLKPSTNGLNPSIKIVVEQEKHST